jgi:hypothetical protein
MEHVENIIPLLLSTTLWEAEFVISLELLTTQCIEDVECIILLLLFTTYRQVERIIPLLLFTRQGARGMHYPIAITHYLEACGIQNPTALFFTT